MAIEFNQRSNFIVVAATLLGAIFAIPAFTVLLEDDAYIHARIVENFISYGQPAFNIGDAFKASSSTGYVLVLAGLSTWLDTISAIRMLQAAVLILIFLLGGLLICQIEGVRARSAFILISGVPFILLATFGGMETPIFVALILGAALAFSRDRRGLALALVALSVWFRFEAFLLLFLAMVWVGSRSRSLIKLVHIWPAILLIAVEFFFYGTVVPYAASAKSIGYAHSLETSVDSALKFGTAESATGKLLIVLLVIQSIRVLRARSLGGYENVFFAFSFGVLCTWMIGRSNLFIWYYAIVYVPFTIGLVLMPSDTGGRIFRALVLLTTAAYLVYGGKALLSRHAVIGTIPNANIRVASYLSIGEVLYEHCPTCSLATSEIGGLGYGFRGLVYDGFGLADPKAQQFHPLAVPEERSSTFIGAIPPQYITFRDPDFIVSMPVFTEALRSSSVLGEYASYRCPFSADNSLVIWGDTGVDIYSKKALPTDVVERLSCSR